MNMARTDSLVIASDGTWVAPDGSTPPAGTGVNRCGWDGSPYPSENYNAPPNCTLVPDVGQELWTPPVPVPQAVARWELRDVLLRQPSSKGLASLCADADALAAQVGGTVENAWMNADLIQRSSPNLNALAGQLGISEPELDVLFLAAQNVTA